MTADVDGLFPAMRVRVRYMLADPEAQRLGVWVVSAFRSIALQKQLFDDAVKRYGSVAAARKWVAPPGKSNHGPMVDEHGRKPGPFGQAVDLGVKGYTAVSGQWPDHIKKDMDALCARFGMRSPMAWEDWHYEPIPGFVDVPGPAPAATPITPFPEEIMLPIATNPNNGRYWVLTGPDGGIASFEADGTPSDVFFGNLIDHPEYGAGAGRPNGPAVAIEFWPQGQGGEGYVIYCDDRAEDQRVRPYHFDAATRK